MHGGGRDGGVKSSGWDQGAFSMPALRGPLNRTVAFLIHARQTCFLHTEDEPTPGGAWNTQPRGCHLVPRLRCMAMASAPEVPLRSG